jgi:hypothetical protein
MKRVTLKAFQSLGLVAILIQMIACEKYQFPSWRDNVSTPVAETPLATMPEPEPSEPKASASDIDQASPSTIKDTDDMATTGGSWFTL